MTSNGFAFSLMTEFIENPDERVDRQHCELKAFYGIARRLKARFPRLSVLLTGDGLYAWGIPLTIGRCASKMVIGVI